MKSLLLDALQCNNRERPPVWLMRQAGRYMPEYRVMRKEHSLWDMFHRPELAAKTTLLPIMLLGVDAAILFSDILVIAEHFGLQVVFPETGGPQVIPRITTKEQIDNLPLFDVTITLAYVFETIARVKENLSVPLIGFCGGPFTIATYFLEPHSIDRWIAEDPESLHRLLDKITMASIAYLTEQVKAGAEVLQVFDSWANILSPKNFQLFCLPYLHRIVTSLKSRVPVILFCRDSSLRFAELSNLNPSCISLDAHRPMSELRALIPKKIAVQGNIPPEFLRQPIPEIRIALNALLDSMREEPGFIVNLGHGVLPDIPFEHVKYFVDYVKALKP